MNTRQHAGKSNFERRNEWATAEQIQNCMNHDQDAYDAERAEWDDHFDEEAEWEKYCDNEYFKRHGGDPWWAE